MSLSWSKFTRASICTGSMVLPRAREESRFADDGSSRHERFRATIRQAIATGDWSKVPPEIRALIPDGARIKTEHGVAYNYKTHRARELHGGVADPTCEIGGHLDLEVDRPDGRITVLDLKGFDPVPPPGKNGQLLGYGLCAALIGDVDEIDLVVAHADVLEDGTIVLHHDTSGPRIHFARVYDEELYAFAAQVRRVIARRESALKLWPQSMPTVEESDECRWCDCWLNCPVQTGHVRLWAQGQYPDALDFSIPTDDARYEAMLRSADFGAKPLRKYIKDLAAAKTAFGKRRGAQPRATEDAA